MSELLPSPAQVQQLSRLRGLQVRRARGALLSSERALQAAAQAARNRERRIAALDDELAELARDAVQSLAPVLPRWAGIAAAERARLLNMREMETFMLTDESLVVDQAREQVALARADLARAQAREDMVTELVDKVRVHHQRVQEQRVEVESDDAIGAAMVVRGPAT